ncbi:unnamed protein product [Discula destructiva]
MRHHFFLLAAVSGTIAQFVSAIHLPAGIEDSDSRKPINFRRDQPVNTDDDDSIKTTAASAPATPVNFIRAADDGGMITPIAHQAAPTEQNVLIMERDKMTTLAGRAVATQGNFVIVERDTITVPDLGTAAAAAAATDALALLQRDLELSIAERDAASSMPSSPKRLVKGKTFDRIAVVWLENTDYDLAAGDPNLAWLAEKGITLENYFGVTHPSEPNYIASHGGDYFGMDNDDLSFIDANVSTIVDLLESKQISWGEYQEDMPYTGYEGFAWVNQETGANDYVRKHNPAVIYNSSTDKPARLAAMKNLTLFYEDLENDSLPQWMFITPNMTSDGHDTSVTVAGQWTRDFLTPLLNDKRFMNNTLVLVTFDENSSYEIQNRVLAILLGDAVPRHLIGTTDSNFYNHYSEIATIEANWDLDTLGRWDVGANVFSFVADKTGDTVRKWDETKYGPLANRYYNQSYDGVFNDAPLYPVYPAPNLNIGSSSGRQVSPAIKAKWAGSTNPAYYTCDIENNDGLNPPAGYEGGGFAD